MAGHPDRTPTRSGASTRRARRIRTYLGLGANVGDAAATLAWAVGAIGRLPRVRLVDVSHLYVTAPWGVADQPEFRNAVIAVDVIVPADEEIEHAALDLLARLKETEREAGRRRRRRWGPRELDVDLLLFGRHRIRVERPPGARSVEAETDPAKASRLLEVPHRDAADRLFVLAPLADLAPRLVPPGWGETVESARRGQADRDAPDVVRAIATWDPMHRRWRSIR